VNITSIIDTCVAIVLAVIVDRTHEVAGARMGDNRALPMAAAVTAVALVPIAVAFWSNIPFATRAVRAPRWFAVAAPRRSSHLVVLPYPAALGGIQSSMAWQATEGMTFSMVGGGGPGITLSRAGPERPGFEILNQASIPLGLAPRPTATNLAAIRQALRGWGVTTVVVPDQPDLPTYDRGRSVGYAVGLFTAAIGDAPARQARAWVWTLDSTFPAPIPMTAASFARCTRGARPGTSVAACVLRSA
jgi:hypothetical protein